MLAGHAAAHMHSLRHAGACCRVRSSGGVVIANKPDRQGESHKYSQASGPYWLHESIKVLITEHHSRASQS